LLIELHMQDETTEIIALSRLRDYAQKALRLKHRSLVSVYEVGVLEAGYWTLIRHGGALSWMYLHELSGKLTVPDACSVLYCLADVLDYLHRREFRGGRVLNWNDFVRCSYNFQRSLQVSILPPSPTDIDLLIQKTYCAPSEYTAPELLENFLPSPAADSFALGSIAFHLFIGHPLLTAETTQEIVQAIRSGIYPDFEHHLPAFPEELATLIKSALKVNPDERPTLQNWIELLAKYGGHTMPHGLPDRNMLEFRKPQYVFRFTNILNDAPISFTRLAQAGDIPMNVLIISEVEDGKYTLNLPDSDPSLPDYCHTCGAIGKPPIRFCSMCGKPLVARNKV